MATATFTVLISSGHALFTLDMSEEVLVLIKCVGVTSKEREGPPDETEECTNSPKGEWGT